MEALLIGAAAFLLESAATLAIDKGADAFAKSLSNKELLKTDEKVRDYLRKNLNEYEYEKVDQFLGKTGIYARDQASCNWSVMSSYTDRIIEDFYNANPSLRIEQKKLTPLIEQAVIATYETVISQLSAGERIIYQQQLCNREGERREHIKIEEDIQNVVNLLAQSQKKLSFSDTVKIFDVLSQMVLAGNFSSCAPLVRLMENQIDNRDRSYCTALDIYINCFIGYQLDVDALCVQFIRENPFIDLLKNVTTFLIQMEQKSALNILLPSITDSKLSALVNAYVSDGSSEIKSIVNENGMLKEEYLTDEAALWLFANYSKQVGNRTSALYVYSIINQLHPTMWIHWLIEEAKALLVIDESYSAREFNISEIYNSIDSLNQFQSVFSQVSETMCSEFIDVLLTCAKYLSIDEFDRYYNQLDSHIKDTRQAKRHWYYAHLIDNDSLYVKELKLFCKKTNDYMLWSAYLCHISMTDPEYVLTCLRDNGELLQNGMAAIVAYYEALYRTSGEEIAFDTVSSLSVPASLYLSFNIFLIQVCIKHNNGKEDEYINAAVTEAINPSYNIEIMNLRNLVQILVEKNRWVEASEILEKYQDKDPFIMFLRLKVLITHEDQLDICSSLIEKLECTYSNNAYFMYCKGVVSENQLHGLGLELFEKAFQICPSPQYAHAVLASRINRKVFVDDNILHYASNHDNVDLLYLSGITYARQGRKQESHMALKQGLINCACDYHEGLYSAFVMELLGSQDNAMPPQKIGPGTCCILVKENSDQELKIWIHNDGITIPIKANDFNGYNHILPNNQISFSLLGLQNGDYVELNNDNYTVKDICSEDSVVLGYCIQILLEHGVMRQVKLDTNNLGAFFEDMRKAVEARSNRISDITEKYKTPTPGLSIELFAAAIGEPYYKALYALLYDNKVPFWSGTDGVEIDKDCILTPSVIGVLSALGIHPPTENSSHVKFYVTNALKVELDLFSREHRNDNTFAMLGFKEDGTPSMIENTPENKRNMNRFFACLNEWANWGESLESISPNEYPDDIRSYSNALGVPNIEAVVWAKKKNCLISCDDLFLRKYMRFENIDAPTTMDTLFCLGYSFDFIMENTFTILKSNYIFPVTINFLKWVSNSFSQLDNEETLGQYSLLVIDLLNEIFCTPEQRSYFLCIYNRIIEQKITLHPTLKWIITSILLKYFRTSK